MRKHMSLALSSQCSGMHTDSAGEHLLIIDVALYPAHQVLDVFGCRHLGRTLVVFRVLPEVFKSGSL